MDIKELNTGGMFIDPQSPQIIEEFEALSDVFKKSINKLSKRKTFKFICLCYDPKSPLRKQITSLPQRKTMSALYAGFTLEGNKFIETVEDGIIGNNHDMAKMIAEYCSLAHSTDFMIYTTYQRIMSEVVTLPQGDVKDAIGVVNLISKLRTEIEEIGAKIFGGDEIANMRKSLYLASKNINLGLQIEDMVERFIAGDDLSDLNPYPDNYQPDKLTFAGGHIPEQNQDDAGEDDL